MAFLALGLAFLTQSRLGTSPISAPMWVFTLMTPLTFGVWNFIFNTTFVILQWVLLRRDFPLWYWIQVPITLFFSLLLDLFMALVEPYVPQAYIPRLIFVCVGVFFIALGVAFEVATSTYFLPGEGIVSAITRVSGWRFSRVKVGFDSSLVAIAVVLSLILFQRVEGVREGTLVAAVFTGFIVGWIQGPVSSLHDRFVGPAPSNGNNGGSPADDGYVASGS
ncbi:YczE/YyaS/YitT family protein [Trueperella bonasi]|nr:DUF6198 family protein [Trueperella bonasi]